MDIITSKVSNIVIVKETKEGRDLCVFTNPRFRPVPIFVPQLGEITRFYEQMNSDNHLMSCSV